jgi:hypothetical protein
MPTPEKPEVELNPCPFCKSKVKLTQIDNGDWNSIFIECPDCLARGSETYTNKVSALFWNLGTKKAVKK